MEGLICFIHVGLIVYLVGNALYVFLGNFSKLIVSFRKHLYRCLVLFYKKLLSDTVHNDLRYN